MSAALTLLKRLALCSLICCWALPSLAQSGEKEPRQTAENALSDLQVIVLERIEGLHREVRALRGENEFLRAEMRELLETYSLLAKKVDDLKEAQRAPHSTSGEVLGAEDNDGAGGEGGNEALAATPKDNRGFVYLIGDVGPQLARGTSPLSSMTQESTNKDLATRDKDFYFWALEPVERGDLTLMRERLNEYVDTFREGKYLPYAWYWIGESWYEQGELGQGRQIFERFLVDYPQHERYNEARYKLADIYYAQGSKLQAKILLEALSSVDDERVAAPARKMLANNAW